ncbi:MAG: 16S rRNA processing protein RimM [Rikenellaceae bacterium]
MEELIKEPVAKITKVYSESGELQLRLYDNFNELVDLTEPLFAEIDSLEVPVFIGDFLKRGSSKATIKIDDIDSDLRALEFVDKELYLYVEDEDDGELYYEDMGGFKIIDSRSGKSGIITEYIDYNDNPLFSTDFNGIEVMIPVNDDIIDEIDEDIKVVKVTLPEGLIELYENCENIDD